MTNLSVIFFFCINLENICDFSGFQQAYYAFQLNKSDEDDVLLPGLTNLSPEQIFFLQYAQVILINQMVSHIYSS